MRKSFFCQIFLSCCSGALLIAWPIISVSEEQDCVSASRLVKQGLDRADGSDEERALYEQAIKKCGGMAEAHYSLGIVLEKQGKREDAVREIEKALDLNDQSTFRVALGSLLLNSSKPEEAKIQFQRVLDGEPKNVAAAQGISVVLERSGDLDGAIGVLEKAREVDPRNGLTHYNLGVLHQKRGQDELAVQSFEKAAQINQKDFDALLYLGLGYERIGRVDEAIKTLEHAAEIKGSDARVHEGIGLLQRRLGDIDKAELALRKALTLDPRSLSAATSLAVVLISKKQESLVEEILESLVANGTPTAEALSVLGWAELQLGKNSEAEEHLKQAVMLDSAHAAAHNNLGVLYQRQGKKEDARKEFNAALSIDPKLESAIKNLSEL